MSTFESAGGDGMDEKTKQALSDLAECICREVEYLSAPSAHHSWGSSLEMIPHLMLAESEMAKEKLDSAVEQFSRTYGWPDLTDEERIHLQFRLLLGKQIIGSLRAGETIMLDYWPRMPEPEEDDSGFLRWLLIDVWKIEGGQCLTGLGERVARKMDEGSRKQE